ncbi:uncharacterized protein LOC111356580 [Spodoptera litura]|uniref:Uncharacterized protein LOC111356580 n=1 Tax=Spodoptera litura TaxID=69820 RepID=A0A9J7IVQ9_SPOLT|nr:uncharacterized protein LOC111356580 [Spodoptera litura]
MKRSEMPLPLLRKCCGCISLRTGCFVLCIMSTMACAANITAGAWNLPRHREREPEDNLISMSMVMFSTLSAISNLIALFGIILKHPSKLQWSLVFNSVFIFCIFLVAIVTCLFRLDDFLKVPGHIVLVVLLLIAGAMYSIYYLAMINSLYRIMKMTYGESAIPI